MKKLFTLLTMLVIGISGMWADDVATPTSKTYGKKAIYQSVDVLSSTEIPTGTYYIKCKSSILVGFTNPFVVDPGGSGTDMNLFSESKLTGDYGKWIITNNGYGTGEGSSTIKYTIQSVVRNTHYWKEGGNAPLGTTARSYSIIYDADKGAYRFLGHVNEGTITNRGYVYPIYGSNKFGRDNSDGKDANAAALYELIPADKVTLEDEICLQNVPHTKWTVTAPNQYGGTGNEGGCANIKDESLSTFYHSDWANGHKYDGRSAKKGEDGLQAFMIDIGEPLEEIVGFAYRARPDNNSGHAKKVRVYAYETLPTGFPTDLSAMSYDEKQNLLKRENNTVLGTPSFDNYNEAWSYNSNTDYKTGMLSQPVKARYILFIQDSGQDAWLTCSDFQIYQNMYITNDKPYLLKIKGKDLYIDTYNGKQSDYGKTFVTAATGTPTYFTLKDSQWQISSTKNRQANFVSIANWDAIVKQSTASNWTIQKADDDSYYLSQNTYYGSSDLKKHYLGANNGNASSAGTKLYTDKATSEAVKIQFEPATEYTVSSNLDQGGIIYLGGTYIKGETFGGISGLTQDVFEVVTVSGYVVDELTVEGTSVSVRYTDDDPSIYRIKSGENITLSNIEDFANKSWIIVAENGTLTIDQDYDLTKIDGAGSVVINADVTLSGGKSTVATGKLIINENKTLTIGTSQVQTNSIESFTSIELAGTIKHQNKKITLNKVTVPTGKTGKIFADDMGNDDDDEFRLAGTTTLNGNLTVCNRYNFQMKVDELAGTGTLKVCGSDNGNFNSDGTSSTETSVINIASASTFTGTVNVINTKATATVQGELGACTLQKTNGTLKYTGLSLNSTTMDGVTLASNERITVQGELNLANITNNLTAGNTGYVFVGKSGVNVTMNFTGNSDLTNGGTNSYNKIGFATGSVVNVNSGSLKLGGYFNGGNSNGSIYVASGASFETTGSSGSNQNIIFPSSTIAGTAKINGDWQGTSTITLNDGAVLEVTKTVAGKLTVADGASVTVRATSTADLTKYGDASYSDGSDGLKIQGYKIATDESSNVTAVNIGDNTYDVSGGLFSADDGIYHVLTEVSTSSKDISSNNILVANNATLTVDDNLTMADGKKITAESGGSIAINEGFTLDASAQAANRTEHRGLITAASGDGTLKLKGDIELITYSDTYTSDLEVNTNIIYTDEISLVGTERLHDHMVVNTGKSLTVHGDLKVLRSQFTANGTVVANKIKLGHPDNGTYTGVLNINDGATVQTGQIYFQNKGGNSRLNMTGGTLEFISDNDIESAIGKKTDATYSISITGGTIKASANATIPAGIAMSIGNVTIETADEKSLAMSNDLTLTGTITNNGTLSLGGALNAETLTVFADGGEGSSYSDGTNGFLSAKKNIVANGDGASTSLTAEQITVGGTDYDIEHEGTGRATVSTEGTSGAYYINEGGDTEYSTVVAKLLTEGDNIVLNGGVLTMDDEYSKPISMARNSTVVVSEGTSLSQGNITGDHTLTINGAGTYNTNYSASVGLGATLGSSWTGTVARANGVVGGPFNINNMVNSSMSKAQLTQVSGWIQAGHETTANIVLINGVAPDDYGFLITGVNDGGKYKFSGSISGDGDFKFHQTNDPTYGDARTPKFEFSGDLSNWNGRFNLSNNGTGKDAEIKVTSTGNINAGFANTAVKASQMKLIFNSNDGQNINGNVSKSENGILYMKLLGTGAKTIAADIDVSRLKIAQSSSGAEITLRGKPEIKVGQLDAYTDDNETSTTSLNIVISDDDITTQWLADNASCVLIDVAGAVNATGFTINGETEYPIGDYKYCISKDANNDIVLVKHYARIVTSGRFGSICLPNASTSWSGIAKVLKVTEVTDKSVVMEEVDEMVAGVPYIFKSNDGTIDVALEGETVDGPVNDPEGYLVGNFAVADVPNSTSTQINYVLQSNQFKKVTTSTIKSGRNRCYLTVDVSSSRLSTLGIAVDEDGATGIDAINSLMDNNAEIYDLNGRKQKDLQKGINIVNGVKVIVK